MPLVANGRADRVNLEAAGSDKIIDGLSDANAVVDLPMQPCRLRCPCASSKRSAAKRGAGTHAPCCSRAGVDV